MRRRYAGAGGMILGLGLVLFLPHSAEAVITRLTPLKEVLTSEQLIFMTRVEAVYPDKPAMVLIVTEQLKDKTPFTRLPINLTGDSEAAKDKHTPQLLKRVAPDLPLMVFASKRGKRYTAFGYTNGTWFQMIGHVEDDPRTVRWAFTHCEPYLRRTFKGTTAELRQVVIDGLSGKKAPPEPNEKEPPGFGPEVKPQTAPKDKSSRGASGPVVAVIPSVFVLGPLALLATIFPAVFGGLLRRWTALLTIASTVSTLYVLHALVRGWIKDYWWSSLWFLWLVMALVSLAGTWWAWRRYRTAIQTGMPVSELLPRRGEVIVLGLFSLAGLGIVGWCLRDGTLLEAPWKELLVVWLVGWAGTAYVLYLHFSRNGAPTVQPFLPAEVIMLLVLGLGCAGIGATSVSKNSAEGKVEVAWKFEPIDRGFIVSSPLVVGDRVYVAGAHSKGFGSFGALYCLDRATGQRLWVFDNDGDMKQVFSTPCVADGRLYIGEGFHQDRDCKLFCLDAATGKKLWECETASHTESSPCVADGRVYVGAGDDGVHCLDAPTGKKLWHFPGLHVDASPVVVNGRLYAGSGVGDVYNTTEVFCLDAKNGRPLWRVPIDLPAFSAPVVVGDRVFFGIGNGNFLQSADKPRGALLCLRARDGRRLWQYDVADGVHSRPAVDDKHVYFGARDQHLYCVDQAEGRLRWKQDLGSPLLASPALLGGSLYVATSGGRLDCLSASDGQTLWSFDVAAYTQEKAQLLSSPLVTGEPGKGQPRLIYLGGGIGPAFTAGAPTLFCLEEK